jgi:hypothetical protein
MGVMGRLAIVPLVVAVAMAACSGSTAHHTPTSVSALVVRVKAPPPGAGADQVLANWNAVWDAFTKGPLQSEFRAVVPGGTASARAVPNTNDIRITVRKGADQATVERFRRDLLALPQVEGVDQVQ